MRSQKLWMMLALLLGSAALHAEPLLPMPDAGSMTWGDWRFSWEIGDANDEGLVIRNVFWKNVKVLHKASLPVIRVKYRGGAQDIDSGCGPYRDRISSGNLSKFSGQFTNVVSRQFNNGTLLEIAVFAEIGGYDLYQAYYFHKSGRLEPMLYSSGWSCHDNQHENDHKHHPYWRLDFDVETTANRVRHARTDANNNMSFAQYSSESGFTVPSGTKNIVWTVSNNASGRVVQIRSPGNELADANGSPWFGFAVRDVGVRRYHFSEDQSWPFSTDSQLGFFTPVEVTEDQDVVFWSMGHLSHTWSQADVNHPDWHSRGWIVDVTW
jgi:hypothetical protein